MKHHLLLLAGLLTLACAGPAAADERKFTYTYEPKTLPAGNLELEQWVTLRHGKPGQEFNRWEFRTEFEYGVTDSFTAALYFNFRAVIIGGDGFDRSGKSLDPNEFKFRGVSLELKYKLLDPVADPIGLLLYGEVTYSGDELEFEQKLVVGKQIGDFTLAYNLVFEQEIEFEDDGDTESKWILENVLGISFKVLESLSIGLEARNHQIFKPNFGNWRQSAFFVGPAVHYAAKKFWITLTVLPQVYGTPHRGRRELLELDKHERVEARLILGVHF